MNTGESRRELEAAKRFFESKGMYFVPVSYPDVQAVDAAHTAQEIRSIIDRVGIRRALGAFYITFTGYADDDREVFEIPECRAFWRSLDALIPEFPIILGKIQPAFDGKRLHILMMAEKVTRRGSPPIYDVVVDNPREVVERIGEKVLSAGLASGLTEYALRAIIEGYASLGKKVR